jgi:hypothetical protein
MKNTKNYTYIYYRRRNLAMIALGSICFLLIFMWIAYDDMAYERVYLKVGYKKYIKISESYVPFVLPYSLCRISFMALLGLILSAAFTWNTLRWLMHKGPLYIISPQGIMDCKRGFVPWTEVQQITIVNGDRSETDKCIHLKLNNPEQHFGGKWRSFFGWRGLGLVPFLMRFEEIEIVDETDLCHPREGGDPAIDQPYNKF